MIALESAWPHPQFHGEFLRRVRAIGRDGFRARWEVSSLKQLRLHPVQYGLVGCAVAIFCLLLLALSERVPFAIAYLGATIACVALIGYYLGHVLGGWGRGAGFAGLLGTLYAALYGLLFLILAAIMIWTRKVDWYRAGAAGAPSQATKD